MTKASQATRTISLDDIDDTPGDQDVEPYLATDDAIAPRTGIFASAVDEPPSPFKEMSREGTDNHGALRAFAGIDHTRPLQHVLKESANDNNNTGDSDGFAQQAGATYTVPAGGGFSDPAIMHALQGMSPAYNVAGIEQQQQQQDSRTSSNRSRRIVVAPATAAQDDDIISSHGNGTTSPREAEVVLPRGFVGPGVSARPSEPSNNSIWQAFKKGSQRSSKKGVDQFTPGTAEQQRQRQQVMPEMTSTGVQTDPEITVLLSQACCVHDMMCDV